eukprot:2450580-Ditylum_brightwellii.AAC.1
MAEPSVIDAAMYSSSSSMLTLEVAQVLLLSPWICLHARLDGGFCVGCAFTVLQPVMVILFFVKQHSVGTELSGKSQTEP